MRRGIAWILILIMMITGACADSTQKAPDYIMEGCDSDVSYRVWDNNLFFARMQEATGISFQFRQYTDYESWEQRKLEIAKGENLPDVLFKAGLSTAEVRDLYQDGYIIDLAPYLETYAPDLWKPWRNIRNGKSRSPWRTEPSRHCLRSIHSRATT